MSHTLRKHLDNVGMLGFQDESGMMSVFGQREMAKQAAGSKSGYEAMQQQQQVHCSRCSLVCLWLMLLVHISPCLFPSLMHVQMVIEKLAFHLVDMHLLLLVVFCCFVLTLFFFVFVSSASV